MNLSLPTEIRKLFQKIRRQIRIYLAAEGLGICIFQLGLLFWISLGIDRFLESAPLFRLFFLVFSGIWTVVSLVFLVFRPLVKPISDHALAILLERQFPEFNDSLLTLVEPEKGTYTEEVLPADFTPDVFGTDASQTTHRDALLAQVREELAPKLQNFRLRPIFRFRPLILGVLGAILTATSISGFAYTQPQLFSIWKTRFLALSSTPWPRAVQIEMKGNFQNGVLKVARGSDVEIRLRAGVREPDPSQPGKKLTDTLRTVVFSYQTEDGIRDRIAMERENETFTDEEEWADFTYTYRGVLNSFTFDVTAGDASQRGLRVEVVDSPTLTLSLRLEYPQYTALTPTTVSPGTIQTIPAGTRVSILGNANKPLESAVLQIAGQEAEIPESQWISRQDPASSATPIPMQASAPKAAQAKVPSANSSNSGSPNSVPPVQNPSQASDRFMIRPSSTNGRQIEIPFGIFREDTTLTFTLHDTDGISSPVPVRLQLAVEEDTLPALAVDPWGIGDAITPNAYLPMKGKISDDYGLKNVGFAWQTERIPNENPEASPASKSSQDTPAPPPAGEKWLLQFKDRKTPVMEFLADGTEKHALDTTGLGLQPGDQFQIFMIAEDQNDLIPQTPRRNRSQAVTLEVVSPEQLRWRLEGREVVLGQLFDAVFAEIRDSRETLADFALEEAFSNPGNVQRPASIQDPETTQDPTSLSGRSAEKKESAGEKAEKEEDPLLALLSYRTERIIQNGRKNSHEFHGIAEGVENICLQMKHNRIDSPVWHERLESGIRQPLLEIHTRWIPELELSLIPLRQAIEAGDAAEAKDLHQKAEKQMDALILLLFSVREKMLKMQDFNEMTEMLRTVIRQEEELQSEIKRANRSGLSELAELDFGDEEEEDAEEDESGEKDAGEDLESEDANASDPLKRDAEKEESEEKENASSPERLPERQEEIQRTFRGWHEKIPQMLEMLRNDSNRMELLKEARRMSDESRILPQMDRIILELREESFSQAGNAVQKLIPDLKKILEKLESEDRSRRIRSETERLRAHLKELNQRIREQQSLEGRTRQVRDVKELSKDQDTNAQKTGELARRISDEQDENRTGSSSKDENAAQQSEAAPSSKQEKENPDPAESKDSPSEGSGKAGKNGRPEDSEELETEEPKENAAPENQTEPGEKDLSQTLRKAQERMDAARKMLERSQRSGALEEQRKALQELDEAKAHLEQILRQLREEETKRTLAHIETQLQALIQTQQGILDDTNRLVRIPAKERTPEFKDETTRLSRREKELMLKAEKLLQMLREDGRARMMAEVLTSTSEDMRTVTDLLANGKADAFTVKMEEDILAALEEMLAAVKQAEREMQEEEKEENGDQESQAAENAEDPALIDRIAELKMIRSAQIRIWHRTQEVGKMLSEERAEDPAHLEILRNLSLQQEKIRKIVHEMAVEGTE